MKPNKTIQDSVKDFGEEFNTEICKYDSDSPVIIWLTKTLTKVDRKAREEVIDEINNELERQVLTEKMEADFRQDPFNNHLYGAIKRELVQLKHSLEGKND